MLKKSYVPAVKLPKIKPHLQIKIFVKFSKEQADKTLRNAKNIIQGIVLYSPNSLYESLVFIYKPYLIHKRLKFI
jgi:hypothetical protein